ncbi:conserved oligomeric Golgi complex subunit 5 [Trichomonascus vanleenenianus]|uniref:Golgi transport complex subunit COG5 n=1 Tax=Trichomonascus vanleenenianus TaxID=2268995 RepID=UPI003ECA8913
MSEYIDYDLYLDEEFSAVKFANSLVLATNNPVDPEIDLDVPSKRLNYDIEEVTKLINEVAAENYEELLSQTGTVQLAQGALAPLKKNLEHINYSYSKLENDILKPYDRAQLLYTTLKKLHQTSSLLRSLTWYLYLARQLDTLVKNPESLFKAAVNLYQSKQQVKLNPGLKSLHIIRVHEKTLNEREQGIKARSIQTIKACKLNNVSKFAPACLALYVLGYTTVLGTTISDYFNRQVKDTADHLTKALIALPNAFYNAANDARDRAKTLESIGTILQSTNLPAFDEFGEPEDTEETLYSLISKERDVDHLASKFWRDVATEYEARLRDYVRRNEPAAKTKKRMVPTLKEAITNAVVESGFEKDSPENRVMINAFAPWNRI